MSANRKYFLPVILLGLLGLLSELAAFGTVDAYSGAHRESEVVGLGRKLFFDTNLSADNTVSCSSCHQPARAFTDGREVSVGVHGRVGTRNTPSLLDVFDGEPLFWDGRRDRLEVAVLDPLTNSVEMANGDLADVARKLARSSDYRIAFQRAFSDSAISATKVGVALAAYVRKQSQGQSAYDRYRLGDTAALSAEAREGLELFEGKAECASCHMLAAGRFTDGNFHHSGVGISTVDGHLGRLTADSMRRDLKPDALGSAIGQDAELSVLGRFLVSKQAIDVGAFRTPSLRNVAMTAPYMHDGSIKTLEAAVDIEIYYRGISTGRPISLTVDERKHLLVFLRSLTAVSPANEY
jgi:cytochrome c peroxidase